MYKMLIFASVKFKPAIVTYPRIEEVLLNIGMCQVFRFDIYCSCCRGSLGNQFSRVNGAHRGFSKAITA